MMAKYVILFPGNGLTELVNTYRSRAQKQWVAWYPSSLSRSRSEWWYKLLARLDGNQATYAVADTERQACLALAEKAGGLLYRMDVQHQEQVGIGA